MAKRNSRMCCQQAFTLGTRIVSVITTLRQSGSVFLQDDPKIPSMRKRVAFVLVAVGLVALTWGGYSKILQARREVTYRAGMMPFQRDLRIGLDRAEVQTYLDSRRVDYHRVRFGGSDADTYEIKIAQEPDSLICEHWTVYVALEFSPAEKLRDIHLRKVGTCL